MKKIAIIFLFSLISMQPKAAEWPFIAYLDGKEMGEHVFSLTENGDAKQLTSIAKFNVKFLFINAYQYFHQAKESWQGNCLNKIEARTEENREVSVVKGSVSAGSFVVEGPKGKQTITDCPMTFAYWNPSILKQTKLLNPQTGEWLDVNIRFIGKELIDVRGQQQEAERYKLEAPKMNIELWYDANKKWLALRSITPEGYVVSYKLR